MAARRGGCGDEDEDAGASNLLMRCRFCVCLCRYLSLMFWTQSDKVREIIERLISAKLLPRVVPRQELGSDAGDNHRRRSLT